jgi:hypothetical protein
MMQSVRWRVLIWVAVLLGAAAAAGLGVDVAVAGLDKAAGLAGVIVGFCELGALVLGIAAWAAERRASTARLAPPDPSVLGMAGRTGGPVAGLEERASRYRVDARHAGQVQIGDGTNIQHIGSPGPSSESDGG